MGLVRGNDFDIHGPSKRREQPGESGQIFRAAQAITDHGQLALQSAGNQETCREALADTMEESERVLPILKTLMAISQAETGPMQLGRTTSDLPELVRDVIDLYGIIAEVKKIDIDAKLPEHLKIQADPNRI